MQLNYHDPALWLTYRYACDTSARNKCVEKKFLEFFTHKKVLDIVDAGSGTGGNFRYYFERLPQNQRWTFIERNAQLLRQTGECMAEFAHANNFQFEQKQGNLFTVTAGEKQASIRLVPGNIDHIEQLADLKSTDVLTANAVFDLISFEQFEVLVKKLKQEYVCLLSTMNYYETSFLPYQEEDAQFIRWYHMYMKRPQHFGIAMGPDCCEEMMDLLHEHGMNIEQESSQWHVGRNNKVMHHFLLSFMEDASQELNLAPAEKSAFISWLEHKKQLCRDRQLEIYVDHNDIFAYPN